MFRADGFAAPPRADVIETSSGSHMERILFICSKNRWRSPTAEHLFAGRPGIECTSAGLSHDAKTPLSGELVEWADTIFVMEKAHKAKLAAKYRAHLAGKRVVCLNIPDNYRYMDPALVELLRTRVAPHLPQAARRD